MSKPRMIDPEDIDKIQKATEEKTKGNYYEITGLPTNGLLYKQGTIIKGRPLGVREVKKLSTMTSDNANSIMNEILSTTITGINIEDIYEVDKLYIIFWLRANTYKNANFTTTFICEKCGKEVSYDFNVEAFEFKRLEEVKDQSIELLNSKDILELDYQRISDEIRVDNFKIANRNSRAVYDDDLLLLASTIRSINEEKKSLGYIYEYINNMHAEDYAYLESYISDNTIGFIPAIDVECTNKECREVNKVPVTFRYDFFIPKYKH